MINVSDVVVLSSKWEGLPLVPIEAGASSKPTVLSDIEGNREVVINEETGLFFKLGSKEDLSEKILRIYKDTDLRKKMGGVNMHNVVISYNK